MTQAALTLFGMISGPVLGLFILGLVYPWTNYKVSGTMIKMVCNERTTGGRSNVYRKIQNTVVKAPLDFQQYFSSLLL